MSSTRTKRKQKNIESRTKITWKEIKRQKVLLFWAAIMVSAACRMGNGVSEL